VDGEVLAFYPRRDTTRPAAGVDQGWRFYPVCRGPLKQYKKSGRPWIRSGVLLLNEL